MQTSALISEDMIVSDTIPGQASKKFMTGEEFRVWRKSRDLTLKEVGDWLGVSLAGVAYYEKTGASRTIALALSALDHGLAPYVITDEDQSVADMRLKPANGDNPDAEKRTH